MLGGQPFRRVAARLVKVPTPTSTALSSGFGEAKFSKNVRARWRLEGEPALLPKDFWSAGAGEKKPMMLLRGEPPVSEAILY